MFDVLFTREAAVVRHTAAPLLAERLRFLEHLRDVGAARKTLTKWEASEKPARRPISAVVMRSKSGD